MFPGRLEEHEEDTPVVEHDEDAQVESDPIDQRAEVLVSEPTRVGESIMKKRKQLPINMKESDYNLDALIYWYTSLMMLLKARAYLLRAMARGFLKRGELDSSEYHINLGEISRKESDDVWDYLIS